MGSAAPSEFILFTGAIIAASALAATMVAGGLGVAHAYADRVDEQAAALETALQIINDPEAMQIGPLELHIMNSGTRPWLAEELLVIVDGAPADGATASQDRVVPGAWVTLSIPGLGLATGDHTVAVFGPHGATDEFSFYVS